jgi:hypothetical protein
MWIRRGTTARPSVVATKPLCDKADPVWDERLDKLVHGVSQRIPVESQNVRGLRLALRCSASKRGSHWTLRAHRPEAAT